MIYTESAKSKLWQDIASGMQKAFRCNVGEAFHIDQYKTGHVRFTETLPGNSVAANTAMKALESASPAITKVYMSPMARGSRMLYAIDVEFDPCIAESYYSDGKNAIATLEKDGKKYVVQNDGTATEVDDPDKYVDNLNKTTGSRYKKEAVSEDVELGLDEVVALANDALDGTGVTITNEGDRIVMRGDENLIKPTQEYLPEITYAPDSIGGGYCADTGDLTLDIPEFADESDIGTLRDFIVAAVNCIVDAVEKDKDAESKEWVAAYNAAEPKDSYAEKYAFKGESFVDGSKSKVCILVKSLMKESMDDARKVAVKYMGEAIASRLLPSVDDEWVEAFRTAEADESLARKYRYLGESFVADGKSHVAAVAKSLMMESVDDAHTMLCKHMDADMADGLIRKYAPAAIAESRKASYTAEMELLDKLHESTLTDATCKGAKAETGSLIEKNLK